MKSGFGPVAGPRFSLGREDVVLILLFCLLRPCPEWFGKRLLCTPSGTPVVLTKEAVRERLMLLVDEEERLWLPGRGDG